MNFPNFEGKLTVSAATVFTQYHMDMLLYKNNILNYKAFFIWILKNSGVYLVL